MVLCLVAHRSPWTTINTYHHHNYHHRHHNNNDDDDDDDENYQQQLHKNFRRINNMTDAE